MDRLEAAKTIGASMAVAVSVAIQQTLAGFINHHVSKGTAIVVSLGAVAALYVSIQTLLKYLSVRKPVRKIIFGKQFIEGTWLDVMLDGPNVVQYGKTTIGWSGENFTMEGEDYDFEGHHGTYQAEIVIVRWPKIYYKYNYNHSSCVDNVRREGWGEAQFMQAPSGGLCNEYRGFYFNFTFGHNENERILYVGSRVTNPNDLRQLDDILEKRKLMWEHCKNYRIIIEQISKAQSATT